MLDGDWSSDVCSSDLSMGPDVFLADSTLYLEMFGIVTVAWQWLKQALAATQALAKKPSAKDVLFYQGKLHAFRFFFGYELPKTLGLSTRLVDPDTVTISMKAEFFKD
jgi:butyryl-CoA dehydrogenase